MNLLIHLGDFDLWKYYCPVFQLHLREVYCHLFVKLIIKLIV